MKIFVNQDIRNLFLRLAWAMAAFLILAEALLWLLYGCPALWLLLIALAAAGTVLLICYFYFRRQNRILEQATSQISAYLSGDENARIDCDEEGELYRLFHCVNALAAVLNAHAANESREKVFLKATISDIFHQLKTPLAALSIYNGLLQGEEDASPSVKEYAALSERELDRIETLVQNLLKITKLDAGSIVMEKHIENLGDMMRDVELHFAYRARQEQKVLLLSGPETAPLPCDRDWLMEAVDNLVKNALDHTSCGDTIRLEWQVLSSAVQITVKDTGCGIHPEDLHHIFKRFYRSRFSLDHQGIGLGLPLAKAIVEAHNGAITVDSELGRGTVFTINFLNPTKL